MCRLAFLIPSFFSNLLNLIPSEWRLIFSPSLLVNTHLEILGLLSVSCPLHLFFFPGQLETGISIVKLQGRFFKPFLVRFPLFPLKKGVVTDNEIQKRK